MRALYRLNYGDGEPVLGSFGAIQGALVIQGYGEARKRAIRRSVFDLEPVHVSRYDTGRKVAVVTRGKVQRP
jgi:hypothetical protein